MIHSGVTLTAYKSAPAPQQESGVSMSLAPFHKSASEVRFSLPAGQQEKVPVP